MRYNFSGLPRRIKETREAYGGIGMSREQLGKLIEIPGKIDGVSRQAVARWEQPYDRDRNSVPDLETLSRIADVLGIDFLWLLTGQQYVENLEGTEGVSIPVYRLEDFHNKRAPIFYRRTLCGVPEGTIGLRVSDLSNTPEYMPLDVVITSPCPKPQPGKMMVARLTRKGVNVFARCVISGLDDGGRPVFALVPLKPEYPKFSSANEEITLLAVAIEHHRKFAGTELAD